MLAANNSTSLLSDLQQCFSFIYTATGASVGVVNLYKLVKSHMKRSTQKKRRKENASGQCHCRCSRC